MRTALLSTLELTREGRPRAFQRLGGRPLIAWQMDLARKLACDRIICLSRANEDKLQYIRDLADEADVEIQFSAGPLPLVGMLTADQELLVIADGLVIDHEAIPDEFGHKPCVLALPDDAGTAAGFERIDSEHAWAGLLLARANIAAQLADMPADSDTVSLLLRLALQSGAQMRTIEEDLLNSGEWLLVRESDALDLREQALLDRMVERASWLAPGIALSRRIARLLAPDALTRGPVIACALGVSAGLGAIGLAHFGYQIIALGVFAVSALALLVAQALYRLVARLRGTASSAARERWLNLLTDIILMVTLTLPANLAQAPQKLYLPLLLVTTLRLAESLVPARLKQAISDRFTLSLILMSAAGLSVFDLAIAGLPLLTLASCLFFQRKTKITQA